MYVTYECLNEYIKMKHKVGTEHKCSLFSLRLIIFSYEIYEYIVIYLVFIKNQHLQNI